MRFSNGSDLRLSQFGINAADPYQSVMIFDTRGRATFQFKKKASTIHAKPAKVRTIAFQLNAQFPSERGQCPFYAITVTMTDGKKLESYMAIETLWGYKDEMAFKNNRRWNLEFCGNTKAWERLSEIWVGAPPPPRPKPGKAPKPKAVAQKSKTTKRVDRSNGR